MDSFLYFSSRTIIDLLDCLIAICIAHSASCDTLSGQNNIDHPEAFLVLSKKTETFREEVFRRLVRVYIARGIIISRHWDTKTP